MSLIFTETFASLSVPLNWKIFWLMFHSVGTIVMEEIVKTQNVETQNVKEE